AARVGFERGMVVFQVGQFFPTDLDQLGLLLENVAPGDKLMFRLLRIGRDYMQAYAVPLTARSGGDGRGPGEPEAPMRIVIAPDKCKEALPATQVCDAIACGVRDACPDAHIACIPMADGGEGTVDALVAATGGTFRDTRVTGP